MQYITTDDAKTILKEIKTNYTIREEAFARLMFTYGLSIDEILNLTIYDFTIQKIDKKYIPVCQVDNRKIMITENMYETVSDYLDVAHMKAREGYKENYYKYAIAPKTRETTLEDCEEENYYVFLGSDGKPLTKTEWNNVFKKILEACVFNFIEDAKCYVISKEWERQIAVLEYLQKEWSWLHEGVE